jgi:hypothetical protein
MQLAYCIIQYETEIFCTSRTQNYITNKTSFRNTDFYVILDTFYWQQLYPFVNILNLLLNLLFNRQQFIKKKQKRILILKYKYCITEIEHRRVLRYIRNLFNTKAAADRDDSYLIYRVGGPELRSLFSRGNT